MIKKARIDGLRKELLHSQKLKVLSQTQPALIEFKATICWAVWRAGGRPWLHSRCLLSAFGRSDKSMLPV